MTKELVDIKAFGQQNSILEAQLSGTFTGEGLNEGLHKGGRTEGGRGSFINEGTLAWELDEVLEDHD